MKTTNTFKGAVIALFLILGITTKINAQTSMVPPCLTSTGYIVQNMNNYSVSFNYEIVNAGCVLLHGAGPFSLAAMGGSGSTYTIPLSLFAGAGDIIIILVDVNGDTVMHQVSGGGGTCGFPNTDSNTTSPGGYAWNMDWFCDHTVIH